MTPHQAPQKPRSVKVAVYLFWASLIAGFSMDVLNCPNLMNLPMSQISLFFLGPLVSAFLIINISAGRNWARITFLFFFILFASFTVMQLQEKIAQTVVFGVLSGTRVLVEAWGLILLFIRPGDRWFAGQPVMSRQSLQKPRLVRIAINLFWAGFATSILMTVVDWPVLTDNVEPMFVGSVLVIVLATYAFLIIKISVGRNWARIVYLVSFTLNASYMFMAGHDESVRSPLVSLLSVAQIVMDACGLVLLFTQAANGWFRNQAQTESLHGAASPSHSQ